MGDAKKALDNFNKALDSADEKEIARGISMVRCAAGAMMMMAPRRTARGWTGIDNDTVPTRMAMRGLGARDLAIGMGTLFALSHGGPVRGWVEAGMLSDGADALNGLVAMPNAPKIRSIFWMVASGAAALAGYRISLTIDD
jgi:hypothetical protein